MTAHWTGGANAALPTDADGATLVGRAWDAAASGPIVVAIRGGEAFDLSATFATMRDVTEHATPAEAVAAATGRRLDTLDALIRNTAADTRDPSIVVEESAVPRTVARKETPRTVDLDESPASTPSVDSRLNVAFKPPPRSSWPRRPQRLVGPTPLLTSVVLFGAPA